MAVFLFLCVLLLVGTITSGTSPYCCSPVEKGTCCQRFGLNEKHDSNVILSASTSYSTKHLPNRSGLFEIDNKNLPDGGIAGWAVKTNDVNQWIQVDFGYARKVTGVLLQGRGNPTTYDQWVTSFRVLFSDDGDVFYSTPVMEGTFDRNTVARRFFDHPIVARYFRINPVTWHNFIVLRFDLLGCDVMCDGRK